MKPASIQYRPHPGGERGEVQARSPNIDKAADHFSLDPAEQFAAIKAMRGQGQHLRAVYHSHPETPARPSLEDIRLAYDPEISYVIISLADPERFEVKSFRISQGQVSSEEIQLVDEPSLG